MSLREYIILEHSNGLRLLSSLMVGVFPYVFQMLHIEVNNIYTIVTQVFRFCAPHVMCIRDYFIELFPLII